MQASKQTHWENPVGKFFFFFLIVEQFVLLIDHTRNSKISQPIQRLKPNSDTGSAPLHTQASIRKHAEGYYFGKGGLLNLQTTIDPHQAEKILLA